MRLIPGNHHRQLISQIHTRAGKTFRLRLEMLEDRTLPAVNLLHPYSGLTFSPEARLAPATFAIDPQLQVHRVDNLGATPGAAHAVVFFESSVADVQVLRQG